MLYVQAVKIWLTSFQTLLRNYEADIDTLNKQQKAAVERAEQAQALDMKNANRKIKLEQVSLNYHHG